MRVWKLKTWDGQYDSTDDGTFVTPNVAVTAMAHRVSKMYDVKSGFTFALTDENKLEIKTFEDDAVTLAPDHVIGSDPDLPFDVIQRQVLRLVLARVVIAAVDADVTALVEQWANEQKNAGEWRPQS